jgi:hypothetical protein
MHYFIQYPLFNEFEALNFNANQLHSGALWPVPAWIIRLWAYPSWQKMLKT